MKKTNIGFKAGIILDKLGETRLITIAELARKLNLSADETALAAGVKVRYISKGKTVYYVLKKNDTTYQKDKRQMLECLQCIPLLMSLSILKLFINL
jgi:hypothetical protein bfra3_23697